MFETAIEKLNIDLRDIAAKRQRCEELMEKVQDEEKRAKLKTQYTILQHAVDRGQLCLDILSYYVSVHVSGTGRVVTFL